MAQCVKKETLELLLLRGGIITIDEFDTISTEKNSPSVRENIKNRDIRGNDYFEKIVEWSITYDSIESDHSKTL